MYLQKHHKMLDPLYDLDLGGFDTTRDFDLRSLHLNFEIAVSLQGMYLIDIIVQCRRKRSDASDISEG